MMNKPTESGLKSLFKPRTIAIVGASENPSRIGGLTIRFLRQHGYKGKIFPVNPRYKRIADLPCFPALTDIPEAVDLALVVIPRESVLDAFRQCSDKKVPFVILFSAGYAEMGDDGRKEQEYLREFSRGTGMRVVGPNCIGIINPHDHVAASFITGLEINSLVPGSIGLITQSGGIGNSIFTRANDRSIGLSLFVSSGNELDLESSDFLEHLVCDERTRCIALLLEDLKNPKRFAHVADKALQRGKPIVALKVGRSEKGRQAAASHTGAISAPDALYDGLFRQKGICRVFDIDDLLEVANLFARYGSAAGNRVAVLSSSGGAGALLGDMAFDSKLALPEPSRQTLKKLEDLKPAVASIANPMDITTQFMNDPEAIARYLYAFAEDENFDILILTLTISTPDRTLRIAERIIALWPSLPKPLVVCWPAGNRARQAFQCLEQAGVPLFFHPARCLAAVGHFARYGLFRKTVLETGDLDRTR